MILNRTFQKCPLQKNIYISNFGFILYRSVSGKKITENAITYNTNPVLKKNSESMLILASQKECGKLNYIHNTGLVLCDKFN